MSKSTKAAGRSQEHDEHRPNVKLFAAVFGALMLLTGLTVFVSTFRLARPEAITLGLAIAAVKASLVAAIFMHLWGEKHLIHKIVLVTGFFSLLLIIGIIDFTMLSNSPKMLNHPPVAEQHPDEGGVHESVTATETMPAPAAPAAKAKAGKR
jgi:caa(3)-type oxidase subunit IV